MSDAIAFPLEAETGKILLDSKIVTDRWRLFSANETMTDSNDHIIFTLSDWMTIRSEHYNYPGEKGLLLKNTDLVHDFLEDLRRFSVICIEFPDATDGRGYSLAKLLRERHGYLGEMRAVGDVLLDQLFLMHRSGFNAFSMKHEHDLPMAADYLTPFSTSYQ